MDIFTSSQVGELFKFEMNRFSKDHGLSEGYNKLIELAELPDVGEFVLQDKSKLIDVMKIRNSNSGREFRSWFHENCRADPRITTKEYIALLKTIPKVQSMPVKLLRFMAQVGVGVAALPLAPVLGIAAGAGAGAIDAFLLDRTMKGSSPKIFLEELSAITKSES